MRNRSLAPFLSVSLSLLALAGCQTSSLVDPTPVHYRIGEVHRTVTTDSPEAQLWFDRGLAMRYNFNTEEAVACFQRALAADPDCAMAHWGVAYSLGTNYNSPVMDAAASQAAYEATQAALAAIERGGATAAERDLIGALEARYAWPAPEDRSQLEADYAEAMRAVHAAHPDDADVAALTGEALMQLRPWGLWSPEGEAAPETPAIRAVLEPALERWPDHPALCHLYIHAMEAGPEVDRATASAERLEQAADGMGHLTHMPSHIYVWTGRYDDVVRTNLEAVELDDAYAEHAGMENFYTAYRIHNYHFVAYGAMWEGRGELALEYAERLKDQIPDTLLAMAPDLLDVFHATRYHVLVRFGMWDAILAEPEPAGEYQEATRAVWRYARGIALASLGRVDEARAELAAFRAAREAVPETRILFNNPVASILSVADKVLEGELLYRQGDHERAFELLREGVALDRRLNYDEPWGWMEPAAHALGALLTAQGRYAEAEALYRENLERYPENGWALHGLAECLRGLDRPDEAAAVAERFDRAWARADVEIPGSCYCRAAPPTQ